MFINHSSSPSSHDDRHIRTFHGCALLEILISSILDRTPCFSFRDFQAGNNKIDTESVDEWETWAPPAAESHETVPSAKQQPLRSLSVFSLLLELVQKLHTPSPDAEDDSSVLQQLRDLHSWKQSLPSYASISDSRSWTPPNIHLHTMWCYVLCKTAEKIGRENLSEQLLPDAIESTIALIDSYTQQDSGSGCFSLLPCLVQQVIRCLDLCSRETRAEIEHRNELRLHRITEYCKSSQPSYKPSAATKDIYGNGQDHESAEMIGPGVSSSQVDAFSQPTAPNAVAAARSMRSSQSMVEAEGRDGRELLAGSRHNSNPNSELVGFPTTEGSAAGGGGGGVNEFDAFFTQMSPVLLTYR
jgi:hypothetical protein